VYRFEQAREGGAEQIGRPPLALTLAEFARLPGEFYGSYVCEPLMRRRGGIARRAVLVIPGFLATDGMTARLRSWLARDGLLVEPAGVGRMVGLTDGILDGLVAAVDSMHERYEQPVTVVGWSFGGLLARWLSHERPDAVEYVVSLGSPWRPNGEETRVSAAFMYAAKRFGLSTRAVPVMETLRGPMTTPYTAIYSTSDGMVPWQACRAEDDGPTENIAVPSSHVGLVCNPVVLSVLRERLATTDPAGTPFTWQRWATDLVRVTHAKTGAAA
jgi:pimeloyl-ACP methyl ester carboxylesterase